VSISQNFEGIRASLNTQNLTGHSNKRCYAFTLLTVLRVLTSESTFNQH